MKSFMFMLALAALAATTLLVSGCDKLTDLASVAQRAPSTPIVQASDGSAALVQITACPPPSAGEYRVTAAADLIRGLLESDELVVARSGGSARLILNLCPGGYLAPPPLPAGRR